MAQTVSTELLPTVFQQSEICSISICNTWMPLQDPSIDCPCGLEFLRIVDQVVCHKQTTVPKLFCTWQCKNKYAVKAKDGRQMYFAFEILESKQRNSRRQKQPHTIHVVNILNQEVLIIRVRYSCCAACKCYCGCGGMRKLIESCSVSLPNGIFLGMVKKAGVLVSTYEVYDSLYNLIYTITEAKFPDRIVEYKILNVTNNEIGTIKQNWDRVYSDFFTASSNNFGITFPESMDPKLKAVLLAAMFIINLKVFEKRK